MDSTNIAIEKSTTNAKRTLYVSRRVTANGDLKNSSYDISNYTILYVIQKCLLYVIPLTVR